MKIIVIGCGRMGAGLAQTLSLQGHAVTVVDADPAAFDRLGPSFKGDTVAGSAVDRETLLAAGLERADEVLAVVHATQAGKLAALLGPRKG